ncbi:hypothetical protein FVEN_g1521 [Fusarium venenatum]|nr:hypothetical protein FVEN_g1521 [Fusarium venenatum]
MEVRCYQSVHRPISATNSNSTLSTTMSGRNYGDLNNNWRGASRGGGFGRGGNPPRGSSSQQQQQQPQQTAPEAKKNKPVVGSKAEALDKADRAYDRAMVHQAEAIRQNQLRDAELNTVLVNKYAMTTAKTMTNYLCLQHWRAEAEKREDALEVLATMDARLEELAAARAGAPKAKEKEKETVEIEEE